MITKLTNTLKVRKFSVKGRCKREKEKEKKIFSFSISHSKQTREVRNEFSHILPHFPITKHAQNQRPIGLSLHMILVLTRFNFRNLFRELCIGISCLLFH